MAGGFVEAGMSIHDLKSPSLPDPKNTEIAHEKPQGPRRLVPPEAFATPAIEGPITPIPLGIPKRVGGREEPVALIAPEILGATEGPNRIAATSPPSKTVTLTSVATLRPTRPVIPFTPNTPGSATKTSYPSTSTSDTPPIHHGSFLESLKRPNKITVLKKTFPGLKSSAIVWALQESCWNAHFAIDLLLSEFVYTVATDGYRDEPARKDPQKGRGRIQTLAKSNRKPKLKSRIEKHDTGKGKAEPPLGSKEEREDDGRSANIMIIKSGIQNDSKSAPVVKAQEMRVVGDLLETPHRSTDSKPEPNDSIKVTAVKFEKGRAIKLPEENIPEDPKKNRKRRGKKRGKGGQKQWGKWKSKRKGNNKSMEEEGKKERAEPNSEPRVQLWEATSACYTNTLIDLSV